MFRLGACLLVLLLIAGCGGDTPAPTRNRPAATSKDPKIAAIEERVAKVSPEAKEMIEKVKGLKPIVNDKTSAMTLGEHVEDYANNKGAYNITPIGFEASEKAANKRWKILFHYKTFSDDLTVAEWEYNPADGKLYPFDMKNAPTFFTEIAPGGQVQGKKQ